MSNNQRFRQLFPVCLVATVVFDFDVQVEGALAAIDLLTALVWTNERPFNLFRCPSIVLFPIRFLHRGLHRRLKFDS